MTAPSEPTGLKQHRYETRRMIWLPLLGAAGVIVLLTMLLVVPQDANAPFRLQAMGSIILTVMCLLPLVLIALMFYVIMVALAVGVSRLHGIALPPLQRLELMLGQLRTRVQGYAVRANQGALKFGAVLAPLDGMFGRLEKMLKETDDGNQEG
jgi:hypothetical protein